jgi:hypothetical protein
MSPMLIEVPCLNCLHQHPSSLSSVTFHGFYTKKDSLVIDQTKPYSIQVLMYYCFGCTPYIQLTIA